MTSLNRYTSPVEQVAWSVEQAYATTFRWEYDDGRAKLLALYDKGKRQQWNASDRIDWSQDLDPENPSGLPDEMISIHGSPAWNRMNDAEKARLRRHLQAWQISQFLHGEQGALMTAAQLVNAVPHTDAKFYAATQTMDEARHVEVFARYLREKLEWEWPINPALRQLLDMIICDSRWDMKYLGMQILVEGLAMAAFSNMYQLAVEPLVRDVVHYVMKDESRHVAFGVISLRGYYTDMDESERKEREEFVLEACRLMRDRLVGDEIATHFGWSRDEVRQKVLDSPVMKMFRQSLFARVVPNIKKLGLLTPRVRKGFEDLEIIQFEDYDAEAADRAIGLE